MDRSLFHSSWCIVLVMPTTTPRNMSSQRGRGAVRLLRDLLTMIALCFLITLGILQCIEMYLDFVPPAPACTCASPLQLDAQPYRRLLANVSRLDVFKVTTVCALLAFVGTEICGAAARRLGLSVLYDVECGSELAMPLPEKQRTDVLEKQVPAITEK
ncbi:hypothetical protein B0H10DRAFT_1326464 [Mycena sp. CBHHK59/15]|nr:hypothetical protein B0H10DRAFT_1326464 [Mycena sp. CBHHK59/15]